MLHREEDWGWSGPSDWNEPLSFESDYNHSKYLKSPNNYLNKHDKIVKRKIKSKYNDSFIGKTFENVEKFVSTFSNAKKPLEPNDNKTLKVVEVCKKIYL